MPSERWHTRYSQRHHPVRIQTFPTGVTIPKRVRIYARNGYYLLHFWDPAVKRTLYDRVDGDLIDAIAKARQIDQRLSNFRRSGQVPRRVIHEDLVEAFRTDLERRADAGAIALATARRYGSALKHYLQFIRQPQLAATNPSAARVDRQFALDFSAFLGSLMISPNGRANSKPAKMRGQDFVLDAVRAMFEWAGDRERGNLLPDGFRNPFRRRLIERRRVAVDMTGDPDITISMSATFLEACDDWQFRLFAPVVFYGLRPGELVFLFHEALDESFLDVGCVEALAYMTKGRRNKRLPLLGPLHVLLTRDTPARGLIFQRRGSSVGLPHPPLLGASLPEMVTEFTKRSCNQGNQKAGAVARIRDCVLRDAGALTYKMIEGEFGKIAGALGWPAAATLKDFRHSCNTALANGGMPEHERRYLLGQTPGKAAIVTYTHLNKLAEHYRSAIDQEMAPLLAILQRRIAE